MKYVHSLNHSLIDLLDQDPNVVILGEDLVDPYGGAFKVTAGLSSRYPDRVISTPLSEQAIIGMAGGMALRGLKPIVEIMFGDFLTLGMDQMLNHITKYPVMYGGGVSANVIIRTPMGGGRGYGPTHSQSLEKHYLGIPHLKVIAPSCYHDPGQLLKNAVEDGGAVLFVEHKLLYPVEIHLPGDPVLDINITWAGKERYPDAIVRNYSSGEPDVVLIMYGGESLNIEPLMRELKQEEIKLMCFLPSNINHFDFSSLKLNMQSTICIICEEGTAGFGWSAEMVAQMLETYGSLGYVKRIEAIPSVIPVNQNLEKLVLPGYERIRKTILDSLELKYQ